MNAEILNEMAALRAEIAALRSETMLREDVRPMIRQMEAALLAITLSAHVPDERNGRREFMGEGKKEGESYFL
ncbi:hypothetical protein [Acidocella sp.]|jgi:hypothetical protein|uniref:hypothetical protein n=1 Tax=Acidocella sp. TaxID=50710 RepID=UPI002F42A792